MRNNIVKLFFAAIIIYNQPVSITVPPEALAAK